MLVVPRNSMQTVYEAFLLFKAENQGKADRTIAAYRDILQRFDSWLDGKPPESVSADDLLVFTGPYLHRSKLRPISRRPYIACLREFYRWLHSVAHRIPANPAENLDYPETGRKLPTFLTLDNAEKLIWAPDLETFTGVRDAAIISVLLGCGLRVAGVVGLNESNLQTQIIDREPRLCLRTLEKGSKERLLPVPREADLLLRIYLEHDELKSIDRSLPDGDRVLFVTTNNRHCPEHQYHGERRRFTTRGLHAMIRRLGLRAGIPANQLHPHALRHLYGTELAESDVQDGVRQQLLGHSDPRSTQIYTHLATRKLTGDVDRGNPLAKIKTPVTELLGKLPRL